MLACPKRKKRKAARNDDTASIAVPSNHHQNLARSDAAGYISACVHGFLLLPYSRVHGIDVCFKVWGVACMFGEAIVLSAVSLILARF